VNHTVFLAAVMLLCLVQPAAGQVMGGPQGSAGGIFGGHRPVDPNRTSQRMSMNFDLSGGYDSAGEGPAAGDPLAPLQAVYAGTAQTDVRYWRGRTNRFLEASVAGRVNYDSRTRQELIGGEALVLGSSSLGQNTQVRAGGLITYDPASLITQFAPGIGDEGARVGPDHHPPQGVMQQQWLATSGFATGAYRWSARQITTAEYRGSRREPLENVGLESRSQQASLLHAWQFQPSVGLRASYRFEDTRQGTATLLQPPLRTSALDFGLSIQKRYSPVRALSAALAGGAALAHRSGFEGSDAVDYIVPVGSGSMRIDLTGIWSLILDGSREVNVLEGVTPEAFATNAATLQLDANVSERLTLGVSSTYSQGAGLETRASEFESVGALGNLQYGLARCCGLFASYTFYHHRLHDVALIAPGFPQRYSSQIVRIGFTWWLPLYGSF
jgi:hypothetical protein